MSAASAGSCSHCGKHCPALKRCSRCKQASYCGAECQKASWKAHKKTCAPLCQDEVWGKVDAAHTAGDWREVLKWEGRMEELMRGQSDVFCDDLLIIFQNAHLQGMQQSTSSQDHALSCVRLGERRVDLLGKMQRFRDQGECMCDVANDLVLLWRREDGVRYLRQARNLGAEHGFFSLECQACLSLGRMAGEEGRHEEGIELLRNAFAAAPLVEKDEQIWELDALASLIRAIFETNGLDELETLVPRFREAAKAEVERTGRLTFSIAFSSELRSLYYLARLHEARGRPREAAREVRALLDLMRENETGVQNQLAACKGVLEQASSALKVLDASVGDKELIVSMAAELAKLHRSRK